MTRSAGMRLSSYFNSRPSARGDLMARVFEPDGVFQFTPLREGRRGSRSITDRCNYFNSRPSARGDRDGDSL